jgi:hypothetical protein
VISFTVIPARKSSGSGVISIFEICYFLYFFSRVIMIADRVFGAQMLFSAIRNLSLDLKSAISTNDRHLIFLAFKIVILLKKLKFKVF